MRFTHIILSGDTPSKLDDAIRISRKMCTIDSIIIVVPEEKAEKFTEKVSEIKKTWKDVDIRQASVEDFELCALDICDVIAELAPGKGTKDRDIILNIAYANSTFAVAGLFVSSILKKQLFSVVNDEPAEIPRVPFEELIPVRYAILATIPETEVCNQRSLADLLTKAFEDGKYRQLGLESVSPTNMSYHLKKMDDDAYIVRATTGREKEIVISNLGRLMKASFEILHGKPL